MKIVVTGGNGKLGAEVVRGLGAAGHEVFVFDAVGPRADNFTRIDLTNYGSVVDALSSVDNRYDGLDAVVHLAAIPAGGLETDSATFHNNMNATFNVFQAARRVGIKSIVYASSETLLGIPFEIDPPYLPVDEDYPSRPESMYSVVKHLEE
ncbi:MAG: NAD(P)-dependent oxidoreductase, partial [Jatrophihabitans sp.]|nr:NAD(P)-dependent oxidoreductase [Jatrophihabitans sp.]